MRALPALVLLALMAQAPAAQACGHCVEDKIAAVYDHAGIMQALERRGQVAFFAIDGDFPVNDGTRKALLTAAGSIRGVDAASVRVSLELASISLAFDPSRQSIASLEKILGRKLQEKKLVVVPMKLIDQVSQARPVKR